MFNYIFVIYVCHLVNKSMKNQELDKPRGVIDRSYKISIVNVGHQQGAAEDLSIGLEQEFSTFFEPETSR